MGLAVNSVNELPAKKIPNWRKTSWDENNDMAEVTDPLMDGFGVLSARDWREQGGKRQLPRMVHAACIIFIHN